MMGFVSILPVLICIYTIILSTTTADIFSNCSIHGPCFEACSFESSPCDSLPSIPIHILNNNQVLIYKTAHDGHKFAKYYLNWTQNNNNNNITNNNTTINLTILSNKTYQTINGFGGAFTDAVSYNLAKLNSTKLTNDLLYSYFTWIDSNHSGQGGIGYTFGRVPIGSCDFSLSSYTYSQQPNDFELKYFELNNIYDTSKTYGRINIINKCQLMVTQTTPFNDTIDRLHLYAVPWTGPAWMKDNTQLTGGGKLNSNRTYWKTYALYFIKYLLAYKQTGNIIFDAVSVQNEPNLPAPWESMQWTTKEMTEFIAIYLGPMLKQYALNVGIWIHDGQKADLPEEIFGYFDYYKEYNVTQYYIGLGIHWYFYPPPIPGCPSFECTGAFEHVNETRNYLDNKVNRSDIYIMGSEACEGGTNSIKSPPNRGVSLGDWYRGEQYGEDIIGDINNGANGWLDWNIILDINGGPNHANNTCDAPIVIDFKNRIYYKQPMYYYMAHIARFIRPNSKRIRIVNNNVENNDDIWYTGVVDYRMDLIIIVIMNRNDNNKSYDIVIHDNKKGQVYVNLPPHSIQTLLYNN
eukprot:213163_1